MEVVKGLIVIAHGERTLVFDIDNCGNQIAISARALMPDEDIDGERAMGFLMWRLYRFSFQKAQRLAPKTNYRAAYYRAYLKLKKKRYAARTEAGSGVTTTINAARRASAWRALNLSLNYTIDQIITYNISARTNEKAD